jgi:hypothetical protein
MFERLKHEGQPSTQEQIKSFDADRIRQLARIAEGKQKEHSAESKKYWQKRKEKIYNTAFATLALMASHLVGYPGMGKGTITEREWEKSVSAREAIESVQSKEEQEATQFKLEREFAEKFSGFPSTSTEQSENDLTPEEYTKLISWQFGPKLFFKINSVLHDINVESSKNEKAKMPETFKGKTKQTAAACVEGFTSNEQKIVFFDEAMRDMWPWSEADVFYHELGHVLDPLNDAVTKELNSSTYTGISWKSVINASDKPLSDYAAEYDNTYNQTIEDFADTFALMLTNPDHLAEADPIRFESMQNYLRAITENPQWDARHTYTKVQRYLMFDRYGEKMHSTTVEILPLEDDEY